MNAVQSVFAELDDAIRTGTSDRRVATLRRITDLFLSNADGCTDDQVALFDDVLIRLVGDIESKALAELARRLAPVGNAPAEAVRHLANHTEIAVAGPVLTNSQRLTAVDLVRIAKTMGQEHLLAISGRKQIDENVTDVLVERGNAAVARKVAVNAGARFSVNGFTTLVKRAEHDDDLAHVVGQRPDIPPRIFQALLQKATETVRNRLMRSLEENSEQISDALAKVSREVHASRGSARDFTAAQRRVEMMKSEGRLGEDEIFDFARTNLVEQTIAGLSVLCGAPIDIIDRLMQSNRVDALIVPCRAAGLSWRTAKAILDINPACRAVPGDVLKSMHEDFERLSVVAAQRTLRFWQVRQSLDENPRLAAR